MNDNTVCCQNRELTEPAGETAGPYNDVHYVAVNYLITNRKSRHREPVSALKISQNFIFPDKRSQWSRSKPALSCPYERF